MSGGLLGSSQTCTSCITACGPTPVAQTVFAQSKVTVDVGVGTGAVLVEFTVGATSTARATWTYNGISASEYSSPLIVGGYLQGLIGDEGCCGVDNASGSGGATYTGAVQNYSGGTWVPSGGTSTWGPYLDQASGGVDLENSGVGWGTTIMVIPKTIVSNTIDFVIDTPSGSSSNTWDWSMVVNCPIQLPSFTGTNVAQADCPTACLISTTPDDFYHAIVSGTTGQPAINDWIFLDPQGVTMITDGYYSVFFGGAFYCMETANGVVINLTTC